MTRNYKITFRHSFLLLLLVLGVCAYAQNPIRHVVQEGETIFSVSEKYNISVDELLKLNPEIETELVAGQELNVPESVADKTDTGYTIDYVPDEDRELGESEGEIPVKAKDKYLIHVVKEGETIFDIAKMYAVEIAELQEYNDLNDFVVGKVIRILNKKRNDKFITHLVDKSIKTSAFAAMWNVSEEEFKAMNPGISRTISKGRYVYIPIHIDESDAEELVAAGEDMPDIEFECEINEENMSEQYHVALLVPFYIEQVDSTFATVITNERSNLKARQFQFAQFYEGFMLAVDSLVNFYGLNLKLDVFDVGQSVDRTRIFLSDSLLNDVDLIVGPFYAKSFALVSEFAKKKGIMIVNPFSTRENVIVDNPRVVKVKPSRDAQYRQIVDFIKDEFSDYKISVFHMNVENGAVEADTIAKMLENSLDDTIPIPANDLRVLAGVLTEENKKTHPVTPLQSFNVEGITYSVDTVMGFEADSVLVPNVITKYNYLVDSINAFCNNGASVLRKNLVVACGDDIVFATEMLNKLNTVADTFDITLIGLPEWGEYHQLFIENLLKTKTVFIEDKFVDYSDFNVRMFMQAFRDRYHFEPEEMAFEGFDIAWYFMKAFMRYGHNPEKCLSEYRIPLLGLQYYFDRFDINNGQSNRYWHIYQYRDFNKVLRR